MRAAGRGGDLPQCHCTSQTQVSSAHLRESSTEDPSSEESQETQHEISRPHRNGHTVPPNGTPVPWLCSHSPTFPVEAEVSRAEAALHMEVTWST